MLHALRRSCTVWILWLCCMFKGNNLLVFCLSSVWAFQKLEHWDFLRHHKCNKCQTLHGGTSHWALPDHCTFCDLDITSRSEQCQTILTENFYVHIWLSWNFVGLLSTSSRWGIYHYFWLSHIFKGDNWHISMFEKKL